MMEAVVSKWGNSSVLCKPKSLRQLVEERTGMDFETYLKNNPYDYKTDYIECGRVGSEEI